MPVVRSSLLQLKSGFVREVASLEGDVNVAKRAFSEI
jgi:hypothetical protein